jgi:pyruvate/2-oxoglutarate dehydrogenase complex dihydrolipoamide acyltransferase (E2) component
VAGTSGWLECDSRTRQSRRVSTIEIRIPKLGMEMTEATLARWVAEDGAEVAQDQPIYLLETDKVESEIGAPRAGVLRRIGVEGRTYPVGEVIGVLG